MNGAARQSSYRKRVRQQGMVDIRLEIPEVMRDKVRAKASNNRRSMKAEIREAIDNHLTE
jgi:hypothetical protein